MKDLTREAYLGALAENGSGVIGFDNAAYSVLILHQEP